MRFYWERVENSRNFANKVWNASRFIMMNMEKAPLEKMKQYELAYGKGSGQQLSEEDRRNAGGNVDGNDLPFMMPDKWILSKVNGLAREMTENLDKYELGIALQKVYDFIWEEFCDWYIEMVKPRLWNEMDETRGAAMWTLKTVLIQSLKLLHPYMPFVTEEIFCNLHAGLERVKL